MKNKFPNNNSAINLIKNICISWNNNFKKFSPNNILKREVYNKNFKSFCKCLIGIFTFINLPKKNIYFFQGLYLKEYFDLFPNDQVCIIGSFDERKFAKQNNYFFNWSFPIITSVNTKIYRKINFFIQFIFFKWKKKIDDRKCIFFLQEDNQPVGAFFSILSKNLPYSKSICFQHGFYPKNYVHIPEGKNTEYNFIWHKSQLQIIKVKKENTFDVGVPYKTKIILKKKIPIIFVGTGEWKSNFLFYKKSLNFFFKLKNEIEGEINIPCIYRPHPNEYEDKKIKNLFKNKFEIIDDTSKNQRLNNSRSIFIGCHSSLLYEAWRAGHYSVYCHIFFKHYKIMKPSFKYDIKINEFNNKFLLKWIKVKLKNWNKKEFRKNTHKSNFKFLFLKSVNEIKKKLEIKN